MSAMRPPGERTAGRAGGHQSTPYATEMQCPGLSGHPAALAGKQHPFVVFLGWPPGLNKGLVIRTCEMCWWQEGMSNSCLMPIRIYVSFSRPRRQTGFCGVLPDLRLELSGHVSFHPNPGLCQVLRVCSWRTEMKGRHSRIFQMLSPRPRGKAGEVALRR